MQTIFDPLSRMCHYCRCLVPSLFLISFTTLTHQNLQTTWGSRAGADTNSDRMRIITDFNHIYAHRPGPFLTRRDCTRLSDSCDSRCVRPTKLTLPAVDETLLHQQPLSTRHPRLHPFYERHGRRVTK